MSIPLTNTPAAGTSPSESAKGIPGPLPNLEGQMPNPSEKELVGNIENYIGMARVPVGLAGPIRLRGEYAKGDYHIPLATTEGALVASFTRGMKAISLSGGAVIKVISEGVQRAPYFRFKDLTTAADFLQWIATHHSDFERITGENSRFAKLSSITPTLEGNAVTLMVEFTTGDAAGQNMVTICTDRICRFIASSYPGQIVEWYLEVNASGDKKASRVSFRNVRGKRVCAEVVIPRDIVTSVLKTTPETIDRFGRAACYGALQSGTMGVHAHLANGLTALFIACGQDVACVAEASVGTVRMEVTEEGDLYGSVTLPNLIVGTVGGGTGLPTQRECLEMLDCFGAGGARRFAEIATGVCLAGELSILAALAAGHFSAAHERLGRKG